MKTLLLIPILAGCLSAQAKSPESSEPDSNQVLELEGKVLNHENKNDHCKVYLYCCNKTLDSVLLKNNSKKFSFILEKEKYYTVRIVMDGHHDRMICIDTRHCKAPEDADLYKFAFETSLLVSGESSHLNEELADFPIAIIYFNSKHDQFAYNKEYTNNLRKELHIASREK